MVIQIDTREKPVAIQKILRDFQQNGVKFFKSKLYVGDYMSLDNPKVVVDRKQNLSEICANVGSSHEEHERFRNEIVRANDVGIKVIVLIEHGHGFKTLEDIQWWDNPRLKKNPKATSGEKLYKILSTMCDRYDMEVQFCDKKDTGRRIREILSDDKGRD